MCFTEKFTHFVVTSNFPNSVLADVLGLITTKQFLFNLCNPSRLKWFSTEQQLGRIQDFTKGGSNKRPPKALAPRGVRGKFFNFRVSEIRFTAFSGAI